MAKTYSLNPDRKIINGRAQVSAEELADFKKKYGSDKTLRDLLNMDKGLSRRGSKPEASMREKFANQYKDPIRAFASAELGMGEGPGEMRKKAVPSKQRVTTPMKGTAFSEETPSVTPSPAPSRRGISSDMPSSPSGGGMDEDRRTVASRRGISSDMPSEPSGGGMDEDRRAGKGKFYERLTRSGLTPDSEDATLGKAIPTVLSMLALPAAKGAAGLARAASAPGRIARAISKGASESSPTVRTPTARTSTETGRRFKPEEEVQAAESAARGSVNRRQIQEARAERQRMMEEKPAMQTKPERPSPRSRTREDEGIEFRRGGMTKGYAKGGSVRGAGIAQRGVKACKTY